MKSKVVFADRKLKEAYEKLRHSTSEDKKLYSVAAGEGVVISIVIEWLDHKSYERRFGY